MQIPVEVKELIPKVMCVPIVTVSEDGDPHLIIVGKVKEVRNDETLAFGVFKMETTQKNLTETGKMQVGISTVDGGAQGYRLTGKGTVEGKELLFKVENCEALI